MKTDQASKPKIAVVGGNRAIMQEFSEVLGTKAPPEPEITPIAKARLAEPSYPQILIEGFITALSELTKTPQSLAANSLLAAISCACQARADVLLPVSGGLRVPLSLYLATVAESGDRKSTTDDLAMRGIKSVQIEKMAAYAQERDAWEIEQDAWEAQRKELVKENPEDLQEKAAEHAASKPQKPRSPICVTNNATPEGLFKELLTGQRSVILSSDEGGTFFGGYSLSDTARKRAATAFYNELWGAKPSVRLRAGDGSQILIGYRFSMHLMIQPRILQEAWADNDLRDNGFWGRFLVAYPDSLWGSRLIKPEFSNADKQERLEACARVMDDFTRRIKAIYSMPPSVNEHGELDLPLLEMDREALAAWVDFADEMESRGGQGSDLAEIRGLANKAAEHAARIAGLFHVLMYEGATSEKIGAGVMNNAISLARWYVESALRMMQQGATPEDTKLQEIYDLLVERAKKLGRDEFTPHELAKATRKIANVKEAKNILLQLQSHDCVEPVGEDVIDGVKRSDVWRVCRG